MFCISSFGCSHCFNRLCGITSQFLECNWFWSQLGIEEDDTTRTLDFIRIMILQPTLQEEEKSLDCNMREDNIRFKYQTEEFGMSLPLPIHTPCSIYQYTDYLIVALTPLCFIPILPMMFLYMKILFSVSFAYQNYNKFWKPR